VELKSDRGTLKFLVDTGSNKNYINPKRVKNALPVKNPQCVKVQSIGGTKKIDKYVNFNPFPKSQFSFKSQFFVLDFHNFFDGLIGYEFLQQIKATINADKNLLNLPDLSIQMIKKFPINNKVTINANETRHVKIPVNLRNGDFYLPVTEIQPFIFINEGIYRATDNVAVLAISNNSDKKQNLFIKQQKAELNNFEIRNPCDKDNQIHEDIFSKLRLNHLNNEERTAILKLVANNQKVFYKKGDKLKFSSSLKHRIITKDEIPVYSKTYRYPHVHKQEVRTQVSELLDHNIIRHSTSPWSSPVWIVPKKLDASGKKKWRMVIDYRKLNEKTIDDRYPIPNITDTLDKLGKAQYFSALDLWSGFHQIKIDPRDIEKTAFTVENGHYEFLKLLFGLKNAPASFQRIMDNILREFLGKNCVIYLDDILVYSTSLQEHIEVLDKIFKKLQTFNLKVQLDKCDFLKKETSYLGHVITKEGVKPNPDKISAILNWPLPRNETELLK
jgi:hypothetical protein